MPLESGSSIGPYFIDREIGRGGMGVVYLAKDPRLQRDVAIKALPDHLEQDPARLQRFQGEAKALAQLNHPAVAGIHGVEEQDGKHYLILEYVEGETLSDRLTREALSVDEAIDLGIRIAAGVEAAHEAGVIHRDLKPDNIRLTPDGEVKVLDFGLARIDDGSSTSSQTTETVAGTVQHSPTLPGVILGTAAYMSPEQARGRRVDRRTDVWSFGVVLYECLTGASPFAGESASDSIGAVLHKDIELDRLPENTPPRVRRVLSRCLARDKARRYRDMGDVRLDLEASDDGADGTFVASRQAPRLAVMALALVAAIATVGWIATAFRTPTATVTKPTHLSIALPEGMEIHRSIDISRDGRTVAFTARQDGEQWVYLRSLDGFELRRVAGSRDGGEPRFSPDGNSIVFHARGSIYRASVAGGAPVQIARAKWMTADWDEDDSFLYSAGLNSPLLRIPAGGGEATPVSNMAEDGAYAHVWPDRIPGTNKVLFTSWTTATAGGSRILDLETGEMHRLVAESAVVRFTPPARWSASGHLILENWDDGLSVLPFDPRSDRTISVADARPLLQNVFHLGNTTRSVFALSDEGTLVYAPGMIRQGRRLVWVEQDGTVVPILDQTDVSGASLGGNVSLAPDGETALTGGALDLVEVDLERGIPRRLTVDGGNDLRPIFFPDGDRVLYSSNADARWSLWTLRRSGSAPPELLLQRDENTYGYDVDGDGNILFGEQSMQNGADLYALAPDGEVRAIAVTPAEEANAVFSVDGRWIAFESDVSGRSEVYLTRADGGDAPIQISSGGGESPKYGPGGSNLYFRRHRQVLRVQLRDGRPVGEPSEVFAAPNLDLGRSYDFDTEEERMIAVQLDEAAIPRELRVVTGFFEVIEEVAKDRAR